MQFACEFKRRDDGQWTARHTGGDLGTVQVTAATREQAAGKLKDEIRYRLEICPCTGELYDTVTIQLVERA